MSSRCYSCSQENCGYTKCTCSCHQDNVKVAAKNPNNVLEVNMSNSLEQDYETVKAEVNSKLKRAADLITEAAALASMQGLSLKYNQYDACQDVQDAVELTGLVPERDYNEGWQASQVCW